MRMCVHFHGAGRDDRRVGPLFIFSRQSALEFHFRRISRATNSRRCSFARLFRVAPFCMRGNVACNGVPCHGMAWHGAWAMLCHGS